MSHQSGNLAGADPPALSLADSVRDGYERGWSYTPLNGKDPFHTKWQKAPHPTLDEVLGWIARGHNVGVRTGAASGEVVVIDNDTAKHGTTMPFQLPRTVTVLTGGGAEHLYFLNKTGQRIGNSQSTLAPFVDVKGEGGQVVASGSVHPDTGKVYTYAPGLAPWEVEMAELPEWVPARLKEAKVKKSAKATKNAATVVGIKADRYVLAAVASELARVRTAENGTRNDTLNRAAFACGQFVGAGRLDRAEIEAELLKATALLDDEAIPTIKSGLDAGELQPRKPETKGATVNVSTQGAGSAPDAAGAATDKSTAGPFDRAAASQRLRDLKGEAPVRVLLGPDEHRVVTQAIVGLARDPKLFQRGSVLVRAVCAEAAQCDAGIARPAGALTISRLPLADLRTRITEFVEVGTITQDPETGKSTFKRCHPPDWLAKGIDARGDWPGVRKLTGVAEAPFLRPDGTICSEAGFDAATGVLLQTSVDFQPIPSVLTLAQAQAACDEALEVVCDYRFEEGEDCSAWLAALLTLPARHAFDGPAPLFLVDANVRGAGKGLAVQTIAEITLGRPLGVSSYPSDPEELRKRITALALAGDQAVLLDNITGSLGNGVLDAALTTTRWKDRLLGQNAQVDLPLLAVWYATANNATIDADTVRRTIQIRLDVLEETPETRSDFKHPNLLDWVRRERPRLLRAALLILAAYIRAGRPGQGLRPLGSYEGWSGLVRSAVVWMGLPDPAKTQARLADQADTGRDALGQLLAAWQDYTMGRAVVVADLISELYPPERAHWPMAGDAVAMRAALESIVGCPAGKAPGARQVGNRLKGVRRRVVQGMFLDIDPSASQRKGAVWRLYTSAGGDP